MPALRAPASRWTAALVHVLLSTLVIGTIALGVVLLWFPGGLWHVAGLQKLFGIMIGADIVLGPLLTLLVYKPGKRGLRFDLSMIALAQAVFLAYGVHTLWQNRPLFLVGSQQAFALVFASELTDPQAAERHARAQDWPRFHGRGPWLSAVDLSSPYAKDEFLFAYMAGSGGPLRDADLYKPYADLAPQIAAATRAPDPALQAALGADNRARTLALLSIRAPAAAMLVDPDSGQPLRVTR
jgi:hypothetical protein